MGSLHYLLFELVPMTFSHYPILWKGLGGQSHSGSTGWTLPSTGIGYTVQKAVWSPPNQHYITRSSDKDSNKTKDRRRARQFAPRLVMQPCPLSCHLTSVDRESDSENAHSRERPHHIVLEWGEHVLATLWNPHIPARGRSSHPHTIYPEDKEALRWANNASHWVDFSSGKLGTGG